MTFVVLLNWNEANVVKHSLGHLLKEDDVHVVLVDNGSTHSRDIQLLEDLKPGPKLTVLRLPENVGSSLGRNAGISHVINTLGFMPNDTVFMLDGDILYVPGTIALYRAALKKLHEHGHPAACVGRHDHAQFFRDGHNGTLSLEEADKSLGSKEIEICHGFPMAWTQYGLFDLAALLCVMDETNKPFPTTPPFDGPGHGYEDDWLYNLLLEQGFKCYHTTAPLYYHQASAGPRELKKAGCETQEHARQMAFEERFGPGSGWMMRVRTANIRKVMRAAIK